MNKISIKKYYRWLLAVGVVAGTVLRCCNVTSIEHGVNAAAQEGQRERAERGRERERAEKRSANTNIS